MFASLLLVCFCSCLIFVVVVVLVSTINNKTFFFKKNQYRSPLCLHINHHHRHKYPLNEILYNNITERYKLEGLIETVYLLTMQFLPTNNQWKAMLLYYRVNKLQKILVTAWRRRKRLTVAGFFYWIWKQTRKHCSCTTFSSIFYFGQITDLFDILSSALHL